MQQIKKTTAVTNAGLETVLELERLDVNQINLEISNSNANALAAMDIAVKMHPEGTYQTIVGSAAEFAAPVGFNWSSNSGFYTLAAGASGWLTLDNLESVYAVRIRAQSAGAGGSVITCLGQMGSN